MSKFEVGQVVVLRTNVPEHYKQSPYYDNDLVNFMSEYGGATAHVDASWSAVNDEDPSGEIDVTWLSGDGDILGDRDGCCWDACLFEAGDA